MATKLSAKATSSGHGEDSPYFAGWHEFDKNPYDPLANPSGIIQMGLAENQLSIDLLENWLQDHPEASASFQRNNAAPGPSLFRQLALYQDYHGLESFKRAMAKFMEAARGNRVKFEWERLVLTAGATAANELLMFCLADPGEAFLVPTPYYPGFVRDLRWRTGVEIVPVHCFSENDFQITEEAMEAAYAEATSRNVKVKGVIITNPSNPLGTTLSPETVQWLLRFAKSKNIHIVCDEIYVGSVFNLPEVCSFAEAAVVENEKEKDRAEVDNVHIVYSLSKDLGLPGFRVAAIYSYNDTVVKTARRMSSFCMVSSQTQHMLAAILADSHFVSRYMKENQKRLRERHRLLVSGLSCAGIRCLHGNAGLFCWVDMRDLLLSQDYQGELELWQAILDDARINVSPGSSFRCMEPGWFRVCFANMTPRTLQVSLHRFLDFVRRRRRTKITPFCRLHRHNGNAKNSPQQQQQQAPPRAAYAAESRQPRRRRDQLRLCAVAGAVHT